PVGSGFSAPHGLAAYAPPPEFSAATPGTSAAVGTPYSYTFAAAGPDGEPAPTFTVASGSLPPGLDLDASTGQLAGTPTTAGLYHFTVQAANAVSTARTPGLAIVVAAPGSAVIADAGADAV